ncbi:hypothetical protein BX265_5087 [Streptomyces sp. TLI_235]|nr:sialidase family protein [Streptomyces sp. TLI_235]PBC70545.1 hypothetical protein BX265_5087 [Streptomyces sp. TLI_235]
MPRPRLGWSRRRLAVCAALPALLIAATATYGLDLDRYLDGDREAVSCGPLQGAEQDHDADEEAEREAEEKERGAGGGCAGESREILAASAQFNAARTAPGTTVSSDALQAAFTAATAMPSTGATTAWTQATGTPYQSQNSAYSQGPWWAGHGIVSGRATALAADGSTVYLGTAGGGVWKTADKGQTWTPLFDNQPSLSIGAVAVNQADHSVWVGTGEGNSNSDSIGGTGLYRSTDGGQTWTAAGTGLTNTLVTHIEFAGTKVYASTSRGLVRHDAATTDGAWENVLKPDPNPGNSPYRDSWISDVRTQPGSNGQTMVAVVGWRGGTQAGDLAYNGIYYSVQGGNAGTWFKANPTGDLTAAQIGRTTLGFTSNGGKLYAVVEDPTTVTLAGVYVSANGDPNGPWKRLADSAALKAAGATAGTVGGQAWYDEYLTIDPADDSHIYVGLEDLYETSDSGTSWTAIGPYWWTSAFSCYSTVPSQFTCPTTTHPDHHAAVVAPDSTTYFGSDGGVYSRSSALRKQVGGFNDLNAGLRTLQYYGGQAGKNTAGTGDYFWGGLQDNGYSVSVPGDPAMYEPKGGDGFGVIVAPQDGRYTVAEYTNMALARTSDGGHTWYSITPNCSNYRPTKGVCENEGRFVAPFTADVANIQHWVAGGRYIWDNQSKGWATNCSGTRCDWKNVRDLGAGNAATAVTANGTTIYAGWCGTGNGCNPGGTSPFVSGIDTNYGGTWHRIQAPNLPNRLVTALSVDQADAAHVIATYGSYSRHWIDGAGVGHVFESHDGGATWTDITGNLPDTPVNAVKIGLGSLIVGTDVGVFTANPSTPSSWYTLGSGLPNVPIADISIAPDSSYVLVSTHGRGAWTWKLPPVTTA